MMRQEPKLLDRRQLAKLLGVHPETISRWKRSGRLPTPIVNGRNFYWTKAQIDIWSRQQLTTVGNS